MTKLFEAFTKKDWLLAVLRFFIGALFLFSGFTKLVPIEPFELKFIELGIAGWTTAPYFARLLIAAEILLGTLIILNIKPRLVSILIILLLAFFTLYLGYDILKNGNEGNCGCFGTTIAMTPLESIIKNILLLPLVIIVMVYNKKEFVFKPFLLIPILTIVAIVLPFVIYPVDDNIEMNINSNTDRVGYKFPVELMPDFQINGKKIDLTKGEYILPYFSLQCSHCKSAAYKLHIISKQHKLPPVYMVLLGNPDWIPEFIKETKADFPYYSFNDNNFFKISGNSFPKVYYIKDGIVVAKYDALTFQEGNLMKALGQKQ
jgi:uncharacterized membrane protein YphA (DoxX/SURF4 family)